MFFFLNFTIIFKSINNENLKQYFTGYLCLWNKFRCKIETFFSSQLIVSATHHLNQINIFIISLSNKYFVFFFQFKVRIEIEFELIKSFFLGIVYIFLINSIVSHVLLLYIKSHLLSNSSLHDLIKRQLIYTNMNNHANCKLALSPRTCVSSTTTYTSSSPVAEYIFLVKSSALYAPRK